MKEIVVISGKGGTGKTSITASLAYLAENSVAADCDVDAADMHLILNPDIKSSGNFFGGKSALINQDRCTSCGKCEELCRFDAISHITGEYIVNPLKCEGCNVCAYFCPYEAIDMNDNISGKLHISDTKYGPLVHAELGIAEDNSGKLVTMVRDEAKKIVEKKKSDYLIVDGSPGIGCPVISSITGASMVLLVTEPSVSGFHDLERVIELINHFRIKGAVCINKYDLNEDMVHQIEELSKKNNMKVVAKIPYSSEFTKAMIESKSIVEYSDGEISQAIKEMWEYIKSEVN